MTAIWRTALAVVGTALLIVPHPCRAANTLADALAEAQRTGKPLFVMAGSANCGPCQELVKRLTTDSSLAAFGPQFVTLKVDTQGPEWQTLASRYQSEGNTIPKVYVIRADGEQLYAKSGALPGSALPTLLVQMLAQSGTILNEKQLADLANGVESAKKFLADKKIDRAVAALAPCMGTGSYAAAAVEVENIGRGLTEEGKHALASAEEKLSNSEGAFNGAVELVAAARVYGKLPELTKSLRDTTKKYRKDATIRDFLKQAEAFDKGQAFESLSQPKRTMTAYESVLSQYAGTSAAELAQTKIDELVQAGVPRGPAKAAADRPVASTASKPAKATPGQNAADAPANEKRAISSLRSAKALLAKRPERAREYLQQAIELAPGSDAAREAEELLTELK